MNCLRLIHFSMAFCLPGLGALTLASAQTDSAPPMRIRIDARDLSLKLVHGEVAIPIAADSVPRHVALWYPKWVPGSHGPGGPIANIAGLKIEDAKGNRLHWVRTPGEVYRLQVEVPAEVDELRVSIRYIPNQPTTNSSGHDCYAAKNIGVISPGTVLLYPEGVDIDQQKIQSRLLLPGRWQAASALRSDGPSNSEVVYRPTTLRTFVDSPIMCGRYYSSLDLVEEKYRDQIPPHELHVFGDTEQAAELNGAVVKLLRQMVTQTALLIGSHPFDRFEILLAVSDELKPNGLEHSRSTFNILSPSALKSPVSLKGWNRLLIPHEYLHAWCGKYRRPAGMLTKDFHTPKDTELLWVYEGLTQYLGELVEARCGLMTNDEFRHRLTVELRNAMRVQGRQWRTLADTGAASHILRAGSPNWSGLRRSQDYYMEGMLLWLEADAIIRRETDGARSLDDFCRSFLGSTAMSKHPFPFTRDEIIEQLSNLAEHDWDGLIGRRVESYQEQFDPAVAGLLGYEFQLSETAPKLPAQTFRHRRGVDAYDSLGVVFSSAGDVGRLRLGGIADQAQLRPGMKVVGVNGEKWTGERLNQALVKARDRTPIELLIADGDDLRTVKLNYHDGPRHWNMKRQSDARDVLGDILRPR